MRCANWEDYEILDASCGEKLERFGRHILIRPDPQIIWQTSKNMRLWNQAIAHYHRSSSGGGHWEVKNPPTADWVINYKTPNISFKLKLMGFKHTGVFPEQAVNWKVISRLTKPNMSVLNLFAYTGGATLAAARTGATVCHVDASKSIVTWAKENAKLSGFTERSIRWIVDDCIKFAQREQRRGHFYDAIILDPPSYGRGPEGEVWQLEDKLFSLLTLCESILAPNAKFLILNSYTTGLPPGVMEYLLRSILVQKRAGRVTSDEIGLKVSSSGLVLPCGSTAIWENTH